MAVSNEASGLIKMTADEDRVEQGVTIHKIRWVGGTTAGHGLVVQDLDDNDILVSTCSGVNNVETIDFVPALRVNGVHITAMASGVLYVYG